MRAGAAKIFLSSSSVFFPLRAGPWHPLSPPLSIPSHPLQFCILIFLFSFSYLILFFLFSFILISIFLPTLFSFSPSSSSAPSFGSLFFSLFFVSLIASFRSLIIPSLGFPVRFFSTILPSNTSLNNPSPLNTCPIQFFFLFVIVSIRHLYSFTIVNTSSLLILSTQLIFSNPL